MSRYLLAAEADKIQDLIFRSSRLREVVGGSQLLTRFCHEVPKLLRPGIENNIIVNDGGSFRILFDNKEDAAAFGEQLAEVYRRATGGSLTVADELIPINNNFAEASKKAQEALRRAKRWQKGSLSSPQIPYVAFCSSCGIGLAVERSAPYMGEAPQALCPSCAHKGKERSTIEEQIFGGNGEGSFLGTFFRMVIGFKDLKGFRWPGMRARNELQGERDPIEDIADFDPRRYVAYIVADGNDMGKVFGACMSPDTMRALSTNLPKVVRRALAEPTRKLMALFDPEDPRSKFIPTLPLILGGDDIFVLVPAPWALDFAHRFALAYEREMRQLLNDLNLGKGVEIEPTISIAVVISKSRYPYYLAHQIGEKLLQEAKRLAKRLAKKGANRSIIHFEVILGRQLASPEIEPRGIRSTLRPYWVGNASLPLGWGLPIDVLIRNRDHLRNVPHKRLAELNELFENTPKSTTSPDYRKWKKRLEQLLERMKRRGGVRTEVEDALRTLGDSTRGLPYWYLIDRGEEDNDSWEGHGLPDLLTAWDFSLSLDKSLEHYEEEIG